MIIVKIIHVCNTCERRHMQRLTITERFQDINEAIRNVEYNQGFLPTGWEIIHSGEDGREEELMCPTCRQQIAIKAFDEKLKEIKKKK
jgi:hypothetical protein